MSLELMIAGTILVALVFYVLTAGADFGAGVWNLLAGGERGRRHRALIDHAIAPIWEANHVWLILVVTILFAAFPKAFAVISTTLHIPLTIMLVGIVLRGSAFVFRTHDVEARHNQDDPTQRFWMKVFAGSSLLTPFTFGLTIGAIASGRLSLRPSSFFETFVQPWLAVFPVLVGFFALALFMYLAAMYLTLETSDRDLQDDFRLRASAAWLMVALAAGGVFLTSQRGAPDIYDGLVHTWAGRVTLMLAALLTVGAGIGLAGRWFALARACAVLQVTLIISGWALSQYPYLVVPDVTLYEAAAPPAVLRVLLWSLMAGALLLFPSLYYLYRLFKTHAF